MAKRAKRSTALVVTAQPTRQARQEKPGTAEKLPTVQDVLIPAAILLAADFVTDHKGSKLAYRNGTYLHVVDGVGRVVGADGARTFVASFKIIGEVADWLKDGIILANDGFKARVGMIAKLNPIVRVRYAHGLAKAEVTDPERSMVFQIAVIDSPFPDYERTIIPATFAPLDEDGEVARGKEWQPIGINSQYLKHVGEIAKTLEAGLPKDRRSEKGMVVRAFNGDGNSTTPIFFDFNTWPGAILGLSPQKLSSYATAPETAVLLAPAIKLTLAALRAHATRNLAWAEEAGDEATKAMYLAKAEKFNQRVAEILRRAPDVPALTAPEPQPEPEPEVVAEYQPDPDSEADNAEQDAADATRMSGDPDDGESDGADDGEHEDAGGDHGERETDMASIAAD